MLNIVDSQKNYNFFIYKILLPLVTENKIVITIGYNFNRYFIFGRNNSQITVLKICAVYI